MADLAIGISKTAVEAVVDKVKSAIKEEAEKWQTVERDIVFIKDEFEMMRSFLNTATGENMKNQVARTWVRQVRDLSYDTEDCIEFVLHLDTNRAFWWKRLLPFERQATPLDKAVADIKQLRARAEDVNQRNIRYSLTGSGSSSAEPMVPTSSASHGSLGIFMKPIDDFGNQTSILDLTRLIKTEDKGLQVISVYGAGVDDLGTSSIIIKKAYDDPEICREFECRAWVKLMHPFNPHEFVRSLLAGFYANSPRPKQGQIHCRMLSHQLGRCMGNRISVTRSLARFSKSLVPSLGLQGTSGEHEADVVVKVLATMKGTQDSIVKDFMEIIMKRKYLIVLEDVTSIVEWNSLRTFLPDMKNRSRILVSTQQQEIASLCTGKPNNVGLLHISPSDNSVYVLFKELPKNHQGSGRRKRCTREELRELFRERNKSLVDDHWQKEHHLFGRESEINKLRGHINTAFARRANSKVMSMWGMAGVGKSFLVQALCDHYADTFNSFAVVSASATHPFDIMKFCQDLAVALKPKEGSDDIFLRIRSHLEDDDTCLVVIDDLQSKEDWDLIEDNLISGTLRSCIIAISRKESVARHCARSDDAVFRVKGLDAGAAHRLLEKKIDESRGGNSKWDATMNEEARIFIDNCGRLPKLTVALVKYLNQVPNPRLEMQRLNNFMNASSPGSQGLDSYFSSKNGLDGFREVFTWTYSNFLACPALLKKCVFYLSIFTQTNIIRRNRLVRRWIAEGYSEGTDSNSIVEYSEKLVDKLANLGIIDHPPQAPTVTGDMTYCQINSFFLQYVISRETEDNIFLPLEISVLQGEGYGLNPQGQRVGQHLTIKSSWKRDKFVYDNLDFSQLRSLTVCREWRPFLISERMKVLRVLDLEETNVNDDDIKQIPKLLNRLKFLCLRRCIKISCLPDSLGELSQLQTLDIRHTSVTRLPDSITNLKQIQYIRAATRVVLMEDEPSTPWRSSHRHVDACGGIMVPRNIRALVNLHTLGVVNVGTRSGETTLKELKNLTQLHKLGVSGIDQGNIKGFFNAIVAHRHLESLSLQLHMDKDLEWLGKITPPQNLRRLKMYIHVVNYPHWSYLKALGQIRRLQTLNLRFETDQDIDLQFSDMLDGHASNTSGQFSELKVLEIACSSNLHVKFARREMGELEILKVHCLNGSSLQFSGIEHQPSLKHVWLKGSFDDTVKEELRRKIAQHPMRPVCKLD